MTSETYESRRKRVLTRRSADLGLSRVPGRPVWGVVMETGAKDGVTSVVATDDGALSLLTSAGGGIHLTNGDWPCSAGTRLVGSAGDYLFQCSPAWAYPLPENGMARFYLLTFDGVMTAEAPLAELTSGRSPFSDLYYAGHDVCFLARLVTEDPDWRSHKPVAGNAVAPGTQAVTEPPADETPPTSTSPAEAPGSELLLRAATDDNVDEVAILLAQGHGFGPNAKGITPLMAAAHAGALEPLRLLLAAGAPVDVQDSHGYTALMLACNAGHDVCARLLLGAGADIQARDHEGFTAIMFAAKNGHNNAVRLLMERGVDPSATTDTGLSAISLATQKGHTQTVSILLGKQ
ncbi:MAG: ankyrin repeat domain-containing protein [Thermoleophilia bacterium]|nr:ankyrin repeat domain-containing protein [Thermoleophilia bacterium]